MKITFLGTGTSQGIPVIGCEHPVCFSQDSRDQRLRSSVMVSDDDFQIVIDCGPDFRQQMLSAQVKHLDAILFTHEHADHTAGLDDVRQFSHKSGAVPVYAQRRVLQNLEKRFDYIFDDNIIYEGKPRVKSYEIFDHQSFELKNKTIIPISVLHGNLPILGFRIDDFAYLTDISFIEKTELSKLQNLSVLVVDALRKEYHPTHFNLEQALDLIHILKPKKSYLTHISHRLGFHDEVDKELPENVFIAYDRLEIFI